MRFLLLAISVCFVMTPLTASGGTMKKDKSSIKGMELIQTARAAYRNLIQEYAVFGTVNSVKKADIVSYTKGIIGTIWVKNGQKVEKGQKLLSIEGFYKIRDQEVNQLAGPGNSNNSIVKFSPIDGYISSLQKVSGNKVNEGETLLSVIDLKNLIVKAEVFDKNVTIKTNQQVKIISEGKTFDGIVASVPFNVNPETGGKIVGIQITQNEPPGILAGEFVKVVFIGKHNNVLSIPESALLNENGKTVVFIKTKSGYEKKPIDVGIHSQGYLEVLSGLTKDETVVTAGAYELLNRDINEKIKIED